MPKVPKISLYIIMQNLQKSIGDDVEFLPADKCQMFPQIYVIVLGVCGQKCPNYPK